jgi:hypothetical protein
MYLLPSFILIAILFISQVASHGHADTAEAHGYLTLSSDLSLHYTLDNVGKTVMFELTSSKNAWVGFGVAGSSGGMIGGDVVVGSENGVVKRCVFAFCFK